MKKIALLIAFMLLFLSPQAIAASSPDRLSGTWHCDVDATLADLPGDLTEDEQAAVSVLTSILASCYFKFDLPAKTMAVVLGSDEQSGEFSVISEQDNNISIIDFSGANLIVWFEKNDFIKITNPRDDSTMFLYRVK